MGLGRYCGFGAGQLAALEAEFHRDPAREAEQARAGRAAALRARPRASPHEAAVAIQARMRGCIGRARLRRRKPGRGAVRAPEASWDRRADDPRDALAFDHEPPCKGYRTHANTDTGVLPRRPRSAAAAAGGGGRPSMGAAAEVCTHTETLRGMLPTVRGGGGLTDEELEYARSAFAGLRKAQDCENVPMDVEDAGQWSLLVAFLDRRAHRLLQLESLWTLTNLTAGGSADGASMLLAAGGLGPVASMLLSPDGNVREQAVWLVGNVAADGGEWREALLTLTVELPHNQGPATVPRLLAMHAEQAQAGAKQLELQAAGQEYLAEVAYTDGQNNSRFLHHWGRRVARTLMNLCAIRPEETTANSSGWSEERWQAMAVLLPLLGALLMEDDKEVLDYTLIALTALSHGRHARVRAVLRANDVRRRGVLVRRSTAMAERIVQLLHHPVVYHLRVMILVNHESRL